MVTFGRNFASDVEKHIADKGITKRQLSLQLGHANNYVSKCLKKGKMEDGSLIEMGRILGVQLNFVDLKKKSTGAILKEVLDRYLPQDDALADAPTKHLLAELDKRHIRGVFTDGDDINISIGKS